MWDNDIFQNFLLHIQNHSSRDKLKAILRVSHWEHIKCAGAQDFRDKLQRPAKGMMLAFAELMHAQGASTVYSKCTETWDERADELEYHFCSRFISSNNIKYSRQTSEIWIKNPWNRKGPWIKSVRESSPHTVALLPVEHQPVGSLLPAACLGEGGSCGFLRPSSNASNPVWTWVSPIFRGHRGTESSPNRKSWFPHSPWGQDEK